ncbi:MAG: hypothetical protein ACI9OJ_002303 [Myxococcota bacterium]|jgi:hypothetical protein
MSQLNSQVSVALLRGINVGGRNTLAKASLIEVFEGLGATGVKTYIQSGNVVFRSSRTAATIAQRHGLEVPVVIRTGDDVRDVIEANPFLAENPAMDTKLLHVGFLSGDPDVAAGPYSLIRSLTPSSGIAPPTRRLPRGAAGPASDTESAPPPELPMVSRHSRAFRSASLRDSQWTTSATADLANR